MGEDTEKVAARLLREQRWISSKIGTIWRRVLFFFGWAQCQHCVHCDLGDGSGAYRGIRESVVLPRGECTWSGGRVSAILEHDDLRVIHRCPGFEQILYNFKDLGFPADEVARIKGRRRELLITWIGWFVAIGVAVLAILAE